MKEFLRFAVLQFMVCAFVTYNMRAIARADVANTVASDVLYSVVSFALVKRIVNTERSWWAMAGYTVGNVGGSVATILVTRWFWGA